MAHVQQQEFCRSVKATLPQFFANKMVLDIGALDINGSNQHYFENCQYLGIDVALGRNVDLVSKGHELGLPDNSVDTIVSTECFEHDQYYAQTLKNIYRMLKPGGLFFFTCATTGRPEHGTRRTTPQDAPLLQGDLEWSDYYKNLTEADIREILDIDNGFSLYQFSTNPDSHDLYFYGLKAGQYQERDDYSFLIKHDPHRDPYIQLYWDIGNGFDESNSLSLPLDVENAPHGISFELPNAPIKALRLDPINETCIVQVLAFQLEQANGQAVPLLTDIISNANASEADYYYFGNDDPQMTVPLDTALLDQARLTIQLKFIERGEAAKPAVLAQTTQTLNARGQQLAELQHQLGQSQLALEHTRHMLNDAQQAFESVTNSRSWRLTKPLRRVATLFKT